jgi:SnoaL-like domain
MNNLEQLVDQYLAAWNEADSEKRLEIIARVYNQNATYQDPLMQSAGHAELNTMIQTARAQFPGFLFEQTGVIDTHNNHVRFSWKMGLSGAEAIVKGTDFCLLDGERFSSVVGFLDQVPS